MTLSEFIQPELILLFITLLIALSIVWSTLKTGISPMVSSSKASQMMLTAINASEKGPILDLGSGWGTLVISIARQHPEREVIGYELSLFPWLASRLLKGCFRLNNLTLHRADFNHADLSHASILFCYLFPKGMERLHQKLMRDELTELLIVSNTFALPMTAPERIQVLKDTYQTKIYFYRW